MKSDVPVFEAFEWSFVRSWVNGEEKGGMVEEKMMAKREKGGKEEEEEEENAIWRLSIGAGS